ncbi:MAG: hypothetical protein JXR96_23840 [Deltaproteobacteria bacterium]|nr:hypothetical protein [Deltaproteobacteria bacterium]
MRMLAEGGPLVLVTLIAGGLASLVLIAGLVISLLAASRKPGLAFGLLGLLLCLAVWLLAFWGYARGQDMLAQAVAAAEPGLRSMLLLRGHAEIGWHALAGMAGGGLPGLLGAWLLLRALLSAPEDEAGSQPAQIRAWLATACAGVGACLGMVALVDYLRFDEVLAALLFF